MKEEWVGQNYMSNKGSHLKSPAHICRKCLIAFRKVLQWVTSVSKSFLHSAANYVSKVKGHSTLLFRALYLPPVKPTQICLTEFF